MKSGTKKPKRSAALALSWDGVRVTVPARGRKFLGPVTRLNPARLSAQMEIGEIEELRICWVPVLVGGAETLAAPFTAPGGKRIPFRAVKTVPLGDALGVVYRRD